MKTKTIKLKISLIEAKVKIITLKGKDQGYDWWHLSDADRDLMEETLKEIDQMIIQLSTKNRKDTEG